MINKNEFLDNLNEDEMCFPKKVDFIGKWLTIIALILLVLIICFQIGIKHGRVLAVNELVPEIANRDSQIHMLESTNVFLFKEVNHWQLINKVIEGESSGRHYVYGDGDKSFGIAQFQKKTFNYLAQKANFKKAEYKNKEHQIMLLSWAVKNGYGRNWTVYRRIINVRTEQIRSKKNT